MEINITVPDGKSGKWKVETFTVTKKDEEAQIYSMFGSGRMVPQGTYKRLKRNNKTIMSNTPDEIDDFMRFLYHANGRILINGLGLGVTVQALLNKKEVTEIIIIEKSKDVIKLVASTYLKDKRVTIINADAFDYKAEKGIRFNAVWHDIWDNICADNLLEMKKLTRKYGKIADYQKSWCRDRCEDLKY